MRLSTTWLRGSLPTELGKLTMLQSLVLNENRLAGSLPSQLMRLTNLVELAMHENVLVGPLPSAIGNLRALERIDLTGNSLTGSLPISLGMLTRLLSVEIASNALWGPLPPGVLANWPRLEALALRGNQLSGTIPSEIGLLQNVVVLLLESNAFGGELPTEILRMPLFSEAFCKGRCFCILQAFPSEESEWNNLRATNTPRIRDICELAPAEASDIARRVERTAALAESKLGVDVSLGLGTSAAELNGAALDDLLQRLAQVLNCPRSWLSLTALVDGSAQLTVHVATPSNAELARLKAADALSHASLDELSAALGVEVLTAPRVQDSRLASLALQSHAEQQDHPTPHHFFGSHRPSCVRCMRHRCSGGGLCAHAHRLNMWPKNVSEETLHKCMCSCCVVQCDLGQHAFKCHQHKSNLTDPLDLGYEPRALEVGDERGKHADAALAAAACGAVLAVALLARYQRRMRTRTECVQAQVDATRMH
jgi:hypothetical protein